MAAKKRYLDRNVQDVMSWARGQITDPDKSYDGLCQQFCRMAYDVPAWAGSAIEAWGKIPRAYRIGGKVDKAPRGALLYYAIGKHGHVAIAAGIKTHDKCISNDYVRQGKINYAPRTFARWGYPKYLGASFWTPWGELRH